VREIDIGTRVRTFRTAKGWRQADLSKVSGLSTVAVSQIERGVTDPHTATVKALAEALGCPVSMLTENIHG